MGSEGTGKSGGRGGGRRGYRGEGTRRGHEGTAQASVTRAPVCGGCFGFAPEPGRCWRRPAGGLSPDQRWGRAPHPGLCGPEAWMLSFHPRPPDAPDCPLVPDGGALWKGPPHTSPWLPGVEELPEEWASGLWAPSLHLCALCREAGTPFGGVARRARKRSSW